MAQEAVLAAEGLQVRFGGFVAVEDVSITLAPGHLVGLIGPNGAGKTTLLRALAGIQPVTRGVIRVLGEVLSPGQLHLQQHIGFTPDTPPLYEDLTVREFLQFIAKGYELIGHEVSERIDFWLEKVWLTEKEQVRVRQLSRGMRQRLGIARTLLTSPSIVLLDEPSAGLDPAGRVQFRQLLCSLRDQGKSMIVSSHNLLDMAEYCTHVAIMSKGRLMRFGTVTEIATGGDDSRCRYALSLAHPVAGLARMLEKIEGASHVDADGDRAVLEFASAKDDAADLLTELIKLKLPVSSFAPMAPGLEEAYLRSDVAQVD